MTPEPAIGVVERPSSPRVGSRQICRSVLVTLPNARVRGHHLIGASDLAPDRALCADVRLAQHLANGGVQRRRVLHCRDPVGIRHRNPSTGNAARISAHAWPAYPGYLASFLTIGAAWLGHSALTDRLARADPLLLRINLLLLLVVAVLPFPTRLFTEALHNVSGERVFVTMYGLTLVAIRALGFALDEYASREHLYARESETDESRMEERKLLSVLIGYAIAILVGLALPRLAVVFYLGIAVYLIVPFREVARLLFRRS
jgi:TMEM175 potassium channel family protein